jgi:hypothetical protein
MDSDVFAGGLLTILAAGLGYIAARYQGWIDRRRDRRALATAMLSELRWLEGLLRQVYDHGPASFYDPFDHPVLAGLLERLDLFAPTTAERLSHFHSLLRDVRAGVNEYRVNADKLGTRKDEYRRFLKAKAFFAASAVQGLKDALLSEGGALPPKITERTIDGVQLPALPAAAFEQFGAAGGR